jgi:2,3-diaminopropionate biosynthesis protein SbnA
LLHENVLTTIGSTPLVRLGRLFERRPFTVHAKLEMCNPGGSIKDRPAQAMLDQAWRSGAIGPGSVIVESSSGNMGIGLAQACRHHGLRFICVVDCKTTAQNLQVLRAYGAEIEVVTEPDPLTGELLKARLDRVERLCAAIPGAFWPNQYVNRENPAAHHRTTIAEIVADLSRIDFLFVATSTCGTVSGCGAYLREHGHATRVVAVDAAGSLIFGQAPARRLVPGLGAGMQPPLLDRSLIDEVVLVDDLDCVVGCRRLVAREAILAGGSSGGVLQAVEKLAHRIPEGAVCVVILADRGERYLDTLFSDAWVHRHFGAVEHLWRAAASSPAAAGGEGAQADLACSPARGSLSLAVDESERQGLDQ